MAWLDVITPQTGNNDSTEWSNYTLRLVIPAAAISNTGLSLLRVAIFAGTAEAMYVTKAYIGQAADSGDAYDFAGTPSQFLFGGNAYKAIAIGSYEYSDPLAFSIPAGKNLVFSCYTEAGKTATDSMRAQTDMTNFLPYYKSGDDAATVNTTGYTAATAGNLTGVLRIEAMSSIKSINGILRASVKSINGILIANVKSINGIT